MLYRKQKVPVPDDAHPYSDGMVRHYDTSRGGSHNPHKTVIGRIVEPHEVDADGKSLMHPNDRYFLLYKDEQGAQLTRNNGRTPTFPSIGISVGLYAMVLGIATKLGIYQMLCDVYNAEAANAVMDLVMYFMLMKSDSINTMASCLQRHLLFSINPLSDTWYSDFFGGDGDHLKLTRENNHEFMTRWVKKRISEGLTSIAYCVDGTNFDCRSETNRKAVRGKAKSGNCCPVVGAIEAVEAEGDYVGMPLMYFTNPGNKPDMVTVRELATFMGTLGLDARLMIFDRGFAVDDVMSLCEDLNFPWLVMLKKEYNCFSYMLNKYGDTIRNRYKYRILGKGLEFGITEDEVQVFGNNDERKACVGLFYDAPTATRHSDKYITKLDREIEQLSLTLRNLESKLASARDVESKPMSEETALQIITKKGIKPKKEYEEYIKIGYDVSSGMYTVEQLTDVIEARFNAEGFFCMGSDKSMTAQEMSNNYDLRIRSELGFSMTKTQLGFDTLNVSGDLRFDGKFFCGHVTKMVRNELVNMCRRYNRKNHANIDVNSVIYELGLIEYGRVDSTYMYTGQTSNAILELLQEVGVTKETLQSLGPLVDAKLKGEHDIRELRMQERSFIVIQPEPKKRGRPKGSKNSSSSGSHNYRGRKKGSKNKKTLAREAAANEERERRIAAGLPPKEPKPKRGRKKGSKNRKTLEREAAEAAERERRVAEGLPPEEPKVHKGRAKGTKNRKTLEREAALLASGKDPSEVEKKLPAQRTGCKYSKTRLQEESDRELSEKTGIDIIGEEPPRPWTNKVRYRVNKERATRRKLAQARLAQMENPDPSLT